MAEVKASGLDAIVVGSGPNGLAAAITLARAGFSVRVYEAQPQIGGGLRSDALTRPGFIHDVCSAIHPLALASPFMQELDLSGHGLDWIQPPAPLAHPLDDGTAVVLERSVEETAAQMGGDERAYRRLFAPLVADTDELVPALLGPARPGRHPLKLARFGSLAVRSVAGLARRRFAHDRARALLAGIGAHSMLSLDRSPTAGVALLLGMLGHSVGWPFPRGGAQKLADALGDILAGFGAEIVTGHRVASMRDLPSARVFVFDVTPRALVDITGDLLPPRYRKRLARYRYGPGVFKLDWALGGPIPWTASECERAATVHLGGTLEEMAASEAAVARGDVPSHPFVVLAQHSLFDDTRAPQGKHTAWAYCHVPGGSEVDMTDAIESQVERFAPGFRELIVARSTRGPADFERDNPNLVGGDINGGIQDLRQHFARPVLSLTPYRTPAPGVYICSSSTPPGGGVHGMCGWHAARAAIRDLRRGRG